MTKREEQYSPGDTDQRLGKILRGAFDGPPTPLKDIPKRSGESRAVRKKQPRRAKRTNANRRKRVS